MKNSVSLIDRVKAAWAVSARVSLCVRSVFCMFVFFSFSCVCVCMHVCCSSYTHAHSIQVCVCVCVSDKPCVVEGVLAEAWLSYWKMYSESQTCGGVNICRLGTNISQPCSRLYMMVHGAPFFSYSSYFCFLVYVYPLDGRLFLMIHVPCSFS